MIPDSWEIPTVENEVFVPLFFQAEANEKNERKNLEVGRVSGKGLFFSTVVHWIPGFQHLNRCLGRKKQTDPRVDSWSHQPAEARARDSLEICPSLARFNPCSF